MNVGDIIIKAKLALEDFEDNLKDMVSKAKEKGQEAGELLSKAFNKATNIGKGLLGVVGKIGSRFLRIIFSASMLSTIFGGATAGVISLAGGLAKVLKENESLKANVQYLFFAITKALEPAMNTVANIISKIIDLLIRAIQYASFLISFFTGKNIFEGATMEAYAQSMAEAEQSSKGIAKNAKEINKQLAGFDEMNVLSDSSSGGGGGASGGGGGVGAMPTFDLSSIDIEPPKWMVWVKDNWEIVAYGLGAIAGALVLLKIGLTPIQSIIGGLIIAQIVSVLVGIVTQIGNIINFIQDPSWDNFFKLIEGFFGTQGLLGILVNKFVEEFLGGWDNVKKKLEEVPGWIDEYIVQPITGIWDKIVEVFTIVATWLDENVVQPIKKKFQEIWDKIVEIFTPIITFFQEQFDTVVSNIEIMKNNVVTIATFIWNKIKEIYGVVSGWIEEHIVKPVKEKFEEIKKSIMEKVEKISEGISLFKERVVEKFGEIKQGIVDKFSPIVEFFVGIWNKIKERLSEIGSKVGEVVGGAFKTVVNGVLGAIEGLLNVPIRSINGLIGVINKVPGLNLTKLNTFSFPRLAKGGIINQPGRGVMVGSAIAGESGREAVIPLTDSQQMMLLGEAIGRYITVNANIINTLNGRVISRELKKVQNDDDFAFNR